VADAGAPRAAAARAGVHRSAERAASFESAFTGGYRSRFLVADVASGEGREFWHNQKGDRDFSAISTIRWTDTDHVIFEQSRRRLGIRSVPTLNPRRLC
jgi:hypothetical protein